MSTDLFGLHLPLWSVVARLLAALVLGAVIGWEREAKGRAAGLRTHMLVSVGAAAFSVLGLELSSRASESGSETADQMRIIDAVATGVGFLGAGAIIHSGERVHGLTTAASIWVVAALGVAAGTGTWALALVLAAMALLTLTVVRWFEPPNDDQKEG